MRVSFLVDGFNVFHSLRKAEYDAKTLGFKWLDLRSLCESFLPQISRTATLAGVYYFSALAVHREAEDPDVTNRHRAYIACLKNSGVRVELSKFKEKLVRCKLCQGQFMRHEEKETDVALGVKLIELFCLDECDLVVIVSGDSDLVPAIRTAQRLFPSKEVAYCRPYARGSAELKKMGLRQFRIRKETYQAHQFEDPCRNILKPLSW